MSPERVIAAALYALLFTYAITESKLFSIPRILFESWVRQNKLSMMYGFIYCPFCVGFWVAVVVQAMMQPALGLLVPAILIAALCAKRDLVQPPYAAELKIIEEFEQEEKDEDESS